MITYFADGVPAPATGEAQPELVIDEIPAEAFRLTAVRLAVLAWLRERHIDDDLCQDITLATYEALANGVEHAYDDASESGLHTIDLIIRFVDGHVTVRVTDHGSWSVSDDDPRRGRGLPLIHALADDASVITADGGTTVQVRWSRARTV